MNRKGILPIYFGIALLSMSALLLEISLTRVFSIAKWYHFAFMVVSIALLGYGASGSFLAAFPSLMKRDLRGLLVLFSSLSSVSIIIAFCVTNQIPFDPFKLLIDPMQTFNVLIYYLFLSVPFFCTGCCLAIAFTRLSGDVSRIYFSDLLGAGIGSVLVIALSLAIATPLVIVFSSILAMLASVSFGLNLKKKFSAFRIFWIIAVVSLVFSAPSVFTINSSPYKSLNLALNYPQASIVQTKWNPFSKIDVVESEGIRYAPGLSLKYPAPLPRQRGLTVDDDSLQAITVMDGNLSRAEFVHYLPSSLPFALRKDSRALILNSGTGLDVITALHEGAESIVAVEPNPLIIESSGEVYKNERVLAEIENGRTFIKGTGQEFDVIQISLKRSIAASSAGLYAMNENYLFTVEAFEGYYDRLSADGILSITRWLLFPPRESLKITSIAIEALEGKGIEQPEQHLVLVRTINSFTFLMKRNPFDDGEIQAIKDFCRERNFDLIYVPGIGREEVNRFNRFDEPYYYNAVNAILSDNREREQQDYLFDVLPSHDDKPFFFNFFRLSKFRELYGSIGEKWEPFFEGGFLIIAIFVQALALSALFIFAPLYFFRRRGVQTSGKKILGYFFLIGLGYMFIEISLMQRFILFLGQPVYAVSTVLFSLLVFSGLGSYTTGRFKIENSGILLPIISALAALILLYLILLPSVFDLLLGNGLITRYVLSVFLLAPLGFVMGMPFPIGIRLTGKISKELIPWAWCSNGCSSVLGSVAAVLIAISFGFSAVMVLAAVGYLGALALIRFS